MDLNRIVSHFDNFKNTFTQLEKESHLKLNEPALCSLKSSKKKSHGMDFVVYLVIEQQVVH